MISNLLNAVDMTLVLALGASFFMGLFGYIILRYWIVPISKYRRLKNHIRETLAAVDANGSKPPDNAIAATVRKHSVELIDILSLEIPHWYKLVLKNREESPEAAAAALQKMANTRHPDHLRKQAETVSRSLGL